MNPALLLRALTAGLVAGLMAMVMAIVPAGAQTLDKVSFGTNWLPEGEHGGFYQALADGTYKAYGLDVTIVPGGPNDNNRMLLIAGKLDFFMTANTLLSFDAVANNVPVVSIAAIFQKDPQVFLTHPESKVTKLEDLKPLTLFVSKEGIAGYFQWLKLEYGFSEDKVKPYTFNAQPFLADKQSAMQGYVTSEPYAVEKSAKFKPGVLLLADYGFNTYSTLIETRLDLIDKKPDLVQRFVDASIVGWYHYLYGDNAPANEMIKKLNPEMTDGLLAYSVAKMKEYGIVDSGDTLQNGIGAMSDERAASFFDKMVRAHVVRADIDFHKAYTLCGRKTSKHRKETRSAMADSASLPEIDTGATPSAVRLRGVTKVYDSGVMALGPLDLEVSRGEFVSLLGPSGCGKSTALRLIAGLSAPTSGTVQVAGRAGKARAGNTRDHSIGFVFQEPTLMPWTSVRENVRLPLKLAHAPADETHARIDAALKQVGLADFADAYPRELSGGMKMRVSLARALVTDPDHALPPQQRSAFAMARFAQDHHLRHPFGVRVGISVAAGDRDDAAARTHRG
jgi:NitT/TauT family transport system substrate-binding protein